MRALVLGAAASLWSDLDALGPWPDVVIAVNRAGVAYQGRLDHWVTLHPEFLAGWLTERGGTPVTWCQRAHAGAPVDIVPQRIPPHGSSGLFAVRIALRILGARRVVLAGMPIDDGPHFYDAGGVRSGPSFTGYRPEWIRAHRQEFGGRVRSLSGWTRMRLGAPDREWLGC